MFLHGVKTEGDADFQEHLWAKRIFSHMSLGTVRKLVGFDLAQNQAGPHVRNTHNLREIWGPAANMGKHVANVTASMKMFEDFISDLINEIRLR